MAAGETPGARAKLTINLRRARAPKVRVLLGLRGVDRAAVPNPSR
jgi:hypothetical protein